MISPDMKRKIEIVATLAVAGRRACGEDDETIRRDAASVAAKAIARAMGDAWEQETYMEEIKRGIERALKQEGGSAE